MRIGPEGIDPLYGGKTDLFLLDTNKEEPTKNYAHFMPGSVAMGEEGGYTVCIDLDRAQLQAIHDWTGKQLELPERLKICFNCKNWNHDSPDITDERFCPVLAKKNPPENWAPVTYAGFTCQSFEPTEKREIWEDHDLDTKPKSDNELPFRWDPVEEVAR